MIARGKLAPECPFCQQQHSTVVDSRWHLPTNTKRRLRHCHACGERFYTEEKAIHARVQKPTISSRETRPTT